MPGYKFSAEEIGEIKCLLELQWSHSLIINHFKSKGKSLSKGYLSKIRNAKENSSVTPKKKKPKGPTPILSTRQLNTIARITDSPDPPTQKFMASKFSVSPSLIRKKMKKLGKKLVKKPKGHANSPQCVEKRAKR